MVGSRDADLLYSAAELDPTVKHRVLRLADKVLERAEFLLEHGDPRTQQLVIKEYLKIFSKHLEVKNANSEVEELRAALAALTQLVLNRVPVAELEAVEDLSTVVVDMPKGPPTKEI